MTNIKVKKFHMVCINISEDFCSTFKGLLRLNYFAGIGKVLSLEKLNVCNNFLKNLPPAIGQLKSLTSLHLANNQLSILPQGRHIKCIVPEDIHTSPTEGIFPHTPPPPPLWKFQLLPVSFIHFFKLFGLTELPPLGNSNPFCGGGGGGGWE